MERLLYEAGANRTRGFGEGDLRQCHTDLVLLSSCSTGTVLPTLNQRCGTGTVTFWLVEPELEPYPNLLKSWNRNRIVIIYASRKSVPDSPFVVSCRSSSPIPVFPLIVLPNSQPPPHPVGGTDSMWSSFCYRLWVGGEISQQAANCLTPRECPPYLHMPITRNFSRLMLSLPPWPPPPHPGTPGLLSDRFSISGNIFSLTRNRN